MKYFAQLFYNKSIADFQQAAKDSKLAKSLTTLDLILMGVGVIVGTGIFVFTGIGAALYAGPALMLSFVLSGITCAFAALAYAEFASMAPVVGGAYTYSYIVLGEIVAWIVGWTLILEYTIGAAAVAAGWSQYLALVFSESGFGLPVAFTATPHEGGVVNLLGVIIIIFITFMLYRGTEESAKLNRILVFIKLSAVAVFIVLAGPYVNTANWTPFMPFGWSGITTGASFAFFAYIGFDMIANSAEECKDPVRSLPRGILGALSIVTILYIIVTGIMTGVLPYTQLNTGAPVALVLSSIGYHFGAAITGIGVIFGLTTVILVLIFSQIRLFLAMTRDGLLPKFIGKVHPKYKTPHLLTIATGIVVSCLVGFVDLAVLAELVNVGTLFAFIAASTGVFILRFTKPNIPRPFKCPIPYVIMPLSILLCTFLMCNLAAITLHFFALWIAIGLVLYFTYGKKHSLLKNNSQKE